jgi:hypothetical protein
VVLVGCSGGAAGPDAYPWPPDTAPPPDAVSCSLAQAPMPDLDSGTVETVFDVGLPGTGAMEVFPTGDELVVFSARTVHRVSLDGELLSSVVMTMTGVDTVYLREIVQAGDRYGVFLTAWGPAVVDYHFCVLDPAESFTLDHCVPWSGPLATALLFDGTYFQLYRTADERMQRLTFSATPVLQTTVDLTASDADTAWVVDAAWTATGQHLVTADLTSDAACNARIREHVIGLDGSHMVRNLLADDVTPSTFLGESDVIAQQGEDLAIATPVACLQDCGQTRPSATLLTRYAAGTRVLDGASVPSERGPLFLDGDRTVMIGSESRCGEEPKRTWCTATGTLVRVAADGAVERSVEIVDAFMSNFLGFAGATVAPGDYAIAYDDQTALRLMRIRVP